MNRKLFSFGFGIPLFLAFSALLGGCASMVEEQITPTSLGIDRLYARYNCEELAQLAPIKEQALAASRTNPQQYKVSAMYMSGLRQAQREKGCSISASPTLTPAVETAKTSSINLVSPNQMPDPSVGGIGVGIGPLTAPVAKGLGLPQLQGVLVVEVLKGRSAERAGLRPMDVILEFAGQTVSQPAELQQIINRTRPGFRAPIRIWRGNTAHDLVVQVETSAPPK